MGETQTAALTHRQIMVVFSGLLSGSLIAALDQNIVATALPHMVADLGGLAHISWVVTSYLLASTVSTPLYGKLGDLFGRKRLFQFAILVFVLGSVLSGAAQTMGMLIAFRAVQGIGAGGIVVGAQAIISDLVAPAERGRYQGYTGSVWAFASVVGPLVGGLFTEHLSWRWAFYINVPIGAAALVITSVVLRLPARQEAPAVDWLGAGLLSGAISTLVLITTWGGTTYAWTDPHVLTMGALCLLLLAGFVAAECRAADPILPLRLFRIGVFRVSSLTSVVMGFAVFGTTTFLPLYLQVVDGASPVAAGLRMTPVMVCLVIASVTAGRYIARHGRYKAFPVAGTTSMSAGLFVLSRMSPGTPYLVQAVAMALVGTGMGLFVQVLILAGQNAVPTRDLGVATSTITFARMIGASSGVAVFGAIFTGRLADRLAAIPRAAELSGLADDVTPRSLDGLAPPLRTQLIDAFAAALHGVYVWACPVAVLGVVGALCLKELPLRVRAAPTPAVAE